MQVPDVFDERTVLETTSIRGYRICVVWDRDDIVIRGAGLSMSLPEAPGARITVQAASKRGAGKAANDPAFIRELESLGQKWREAVWARIRRDWGERSFAPDAHGLYYPPFSQEGAKQFYCNHCRQIFGGAEMAANLWHCPDPDCCATPNDIFCHDR